MYMQTSTQRPRARRNQVEREPNPRERLLRASESRRTPGRHRVSSSRAGPWRFHEEREGLRPMAAELGQAAASGAADNAL